MPQPQSAEDWQDYSPATGGAQKERAPSFSSQAPDTVEHGARPVINLYQPKSAEDWPDYDARRAAAAQKQTISAGEAFGRGAIDSATFGAAPAISGLSAAGATAQEPLPMSPEFPGIEIPAYGAAKLSRGDEAAKAAYERERAQTEESRRESFAQHPYATTGGELAGGLVTPGFGSMTAGPAMARVGSGVAAGAIGGGLYGAGSAIGEGGGPQEALRGAAGGAGFGALAGGLLHGVLGPRIPGPATTPMQRAAQTAAELVPGGGLPRGLASEIPGVKEATSSLASFPGAGYRITNAVRDVQEAAGKRVGDIAGEMTGGARGRDTADEAIRSGLRMAIDRNKQEADRLYSKLHAQMPRNTPIDIPTLRTAVGRVITRRADKREVNPEAGLEQVLNAIRHPEPISFEGARGLRQDVREAGDFGEHPGLNATDWNTMTAALTADMRRAAYQHGGGKEFDQAESHFKVIAEKNRQLGKVLRTTGQAAIGQLVGAAQERSGYVRMLQDLRRTMPGEYFQHVGGTILHELGAAASQGGEFSLAHFVTGWSRLSLPAKQALFSSQHLKDIDAIANVGVQAKKALATRNVSHTSQAIVLWEIARDAVEGAIAIGAGVMNPAYGVAAGGAFVAGNIFTRWLANPSKAAAMRAWATAHQAVQQNATPVRSATFNFATRRLAHELNIPADRIMAAAGINADASERNNP